MIQTKIEEFKSDGVKYSEKNIPSVKKLKKLAQKFLKKMSTLRLSFQTLNTKGINYNVFAKKISSSCHQIYWIYGPIGIS